MLKDILNSRTDNLSDGYIAGHQTHHQATIGISEVVLLRRDLYTLVHLPVLSKIKEVPRLREQSRVRGPEHAG